MPRSRRRTRRSTSRRSTSRRPASRRSSGHAPAHRRRRTATKLKLYAQPHGVMPEKSRHLSIKINVGRNKYATDKSAAFMACASFGKVTECSESSSPSAAIGRATAKLGNKVADRPSSFAGLGSLAGPRRRRRRK